MALCDTTVAQGGKYTDSPKKESLYYKGLVRGRGEIGKHKGLKTATVTGLVTRVTSNLLNYNNNLEDKTSVALGNRSGDLCLGRDKTINQNRSELQIITRRLH